MPGGDRTGPYSEGPMTGKGFGYCDRLGGQRSRSCQQDDLAAHGRSFRRGKGHRQGHGFRHGQLDSNKP